MVESQKILRNVFRLEKFRPEQERVIEAIMAGKSALAVFPTGAGKSLCYQVPALLLDGLTIVVSPLIALMKDQVDKLLRLGIAASRMDSTLADDELEEIAMQIHSGELKILFVSPERFAAAHFQKLIKGVLLSLVAVDEAHCISEWGHNFRPDYLKLARQAKRMKAERILALTATATRNVVKDIRKEFRIAGDAVFQTARHRDNLQVNIFSTEEEKRFSQLLEILQRQSGAAIVYTATRFDAESVATQLQKAGVSARAYHAGLTHEVRDEAQTNFMTDVTRVIVATTAFGMGVDKSNVRQVIHFHLPHSLEAYSQEIGRAGRDGAHAECTMLCCHADLIVAKNLIIGSSASSSSLKNLLERILRLASVGKTFSLSHYELSGTHDLREETIRTVLAYLELKGMIERIGSYYSHFRVKQIRTLEQILHGRAAQEKSLIKKLFAQAEFAYGELRFDLHQIKQDTGISREKSTHLLQELTACGDLILKSRGLREVWKMKATINLVDEIPSFVEKFTEREKRDLIRLQWMHAYTTTKRDRTAFVDQYFSSHKLKELKSPTRSNKLSVSDDAWQAIQNLRKENLVALQSVKQLARFLCGIYSPASYRARLTQRKEFGMLKHFDIAEVTAFFI